MGKEIKFSKGAGDNELVYPITQDQLDNLQPCGLASPCVGKPHSQLEPPKASELPEMAQEVLEVRAMVARGQFPREFMEKYYPKEWGTFPDHIPEPLALEGLSFDDPEGLANVVHMDAPTDMPFAVHAWILSKGYKANDGNINCIDFIENVPETHYKLAQAAYRNLQKAFEAKYAYGTPRPEEALGFNLTAYKEGCPTHPSYPAGHGAAASAVSILLRRYDLSDENIKVVRDSAYCWAMFRSLAGVHYGVDNVAGLKVGGLL